LGPLRPAHVWTKLKGITSSQSSPSADEHKYTRNDSTFGASEVFKNILEKIIEMDFGDGTYGTISNKI
jgi:hypothetical protein